jgi:hypothetical protein
MTEDEPTAIGDGRYRTFLTFPHYFVRPWEFVGDSPEEALAHAFHGLRYLMRCDGASCEDFEGQPLELQRGEEIDPEYGPEED